MTTYDSPEHESLRAAARSLSVSFGAAYAGLRLGEVLKFFRVNRTEELSPFGANCCRKLLQNMLPLGGDST